MTAWDAFLTERDRRVLARIGTGSHDGVGERPALIVIDVTQAYFGDRDEPLEVSIQRWPFSCGQAGWAALPHIAAMLEAFRSRRLPVIYSDMPDGGSADLWRSPNTNSDEDNSSADFQPQAIMPQVAPRHDEIVITKSTPSVFFGTPLMSYLTSLGADSVVLCGTSTSGCVRSSAVEAFASGLGVAVVEDAVFDRFEASHAMALFDLHVKYAHVTTSDEIVRVVHALEPGLFDGRTAERGLRAVTRRTAT